MVDPLGDVHQVGTAIGVCLPAGGVGAVPGDRVGDSVVDGRGSAPMVRRFGRRRSGRRSAGNTKDASSVAGWATARVCCHRSGSDSWSRLFGQAARSPHQLIGVVQGDHCGATPLSLRFLPARPLGGGACKPNTVRAAAQAVPRSTFLPWVRTMGKPGAEGPTMSTDPAVVATENPGAGVIGRTSRRPRPKWCR